jgi:hypothetical protein
MFGWFKKQPRPEDTEAFKIGQRSVDSMNADLQRFMSARFNPAFDGYIGVLNDQFDTVHGDDDAPPITLARIHFQIFNDNVQKLRGQMNDEVNAAMSEWLEYAEQLGVKDDFQQLINASIGSFQERLTLTGLQAFLDRADDLKAADSSWRQANPERAAEFPPD